MDMSLIVKLEEPRFENGRALLIAGIAARYTFETNLGIPSQWQRFRPYIGNIPGEVRGTTYGVCRNFDAAGSFEYITGVEVFDISGVPAELARVRIAEQRYAVFTHAGHVSTMRNTVYSIWNKWLPESGLELADAPNFERYSNNFNPEGGTGIIEIWVPVKP